MVLLEIILFIFQVNTAQLAVINRETYRNSRDSSRLTNNVESYLKNLRHSRRYKEWGPVIAGQYCATRHGGCCPNRVDSCFVSILDTFCYCDEFCDRQGSDCCLDFWSFCRGMGPTTTPSNIIDCYHKCPDGDKTCIYTPGVGYHCRCSAGWTGTNCNVIDCTYSSYCLNGGTCIPNAGFTSHSCMCAGGWKGDNCETIDCSYSSYCLNGGTCIPSAGFTSYSCMCANGWIGDNCEIIDIDECASDPCVNGTCLDGANRFSCNCFPGYTGTVCNEEIDECAAPSPCKNGATCHDLIADFRCECVPGYTDKYCSTDIDECASDPCQNNGTCQDRVNYFECLCPVGYYGWYCETATCQPTMADVIFLLDSSISQTARDFRKQLDFINRFVDHVVVDDKNFRVGVVTFSSKAQLEISLTDYNDSVTLKEAVYNITYRPGGTFTHLGLETVTQHVKDISPKRLFANTAKRYVFLLTDGMSTHRKRTLEAATQLRKYVTKVLAIGIGLEVSHKELLGVASPGDERAPEYVFSVHNFNALYTIIQQLVALTCDECLWNTSSDVTFLLDMRSGISDLHFSQAVDALTYLLSDTLNKNYNVTVRLALVSFGDESVQIHRHLTDTATTDSLIQYIQTLTVSRSCEGGSAELCGSSNINTLDSALHDIEQGIFSESKSETRQTIILFTNGDLRIPTGPNSTHARLKESGRLVLVVGVGEEFEVGSVQGLVSDPAYVFVSRSGSSFRNLDVIATEILHTSCELSNNF
ncbi:von Willebrand factor A domain-containing protein 2-like [Mya arenaria]|uniref:von Willebrand factor A domain-containing protein 2-like n=1 Tax=Mya arenaria TaxID=6604 RepID=UPI0022E36CFF|nr:von Willebrand factor A domain-containing protein 2-like [Mya arenaria]